MTTDTVESDEIAEVLECDALDALKEIERLTGRVRDLEQREAFRAQESARLNAVITSLKAQNQRLVDESMQIGRRLQSALTKIEQRNRLIARLRGDSDTTSPRRQMVES